MADTKQIDELYYINTNNPDGVKAILTKYGVVVDMADFDARGLALKDLVTKKPEVLKEVFAIHPDKDRILDAVGITADAGTSNFSGKSMYCGSHRTSSSYCGCTASNFTGNDPATITVSEGFVKIKEYERQYCGKSLSELNAALAEVNNILASIRVINGDTSEYQLRKTAIENCIEKLNNTTPVVSDKMTMPSGHTVLLIVAVGALIFLGVKATSNG